MNDTDTQTPQRMPLAFSYVRFSSAAQKDGNSLERQTKAAQAWAVANDYKLSTTTFQDLGISAFKGGNVEVGRLGAFLEAVETGKIPKGSALLVENLDRISRDKIRRARNTLENIIDAGIDVVTLSDNRMYTHEDLENDPLTSVMIIMVFQRAHDESVMKSKRVSAAWDANTVKVLDGTRKRSTRVPSWIKYMGDTLNEGSFEVIEEKAKVIREVFSRYADGEPTTGIATDLRNRGIPALFRGQWTGPKVVSIVTSKAPYGTLEVGKGTKRDRVIIETVKGYYPRIVNEDIQRRILSRSEQAPKPRPRITARITRGALTGVIRDADGERCKVKRYNATTCSYVNSVTGKYAGSVGIFDGALRGGWNEIKAAYDLDTSPEEEGCTMALQEARETLGYLRGRKVPNAMMIVAAEADVEELQGKLAEIREGAGIELSEVPDDVSGLDPHALNGFVRLLISEVTFQKQERRVLLRVALKNGVRVHVGDHTVPFR